ncbi:MAG: DNA repair protein RadC [Bacteroidota bacterium]
MEVKLESFSIKHWADDDRPREKLLSKGRAALSDAELIAILIGSGSREQSAVDLSKQILAHVDNDLNALGRLSINQLMHFKGIGEAKAISIAAALEIGRRRRGSDAKKITKITSSEDVFHLLHPLLGELPHEEFWILYLNNANTVLYKEQLSKGGLTGTLVDVRLVMKHALAYGAVGLILAHNHPSGTLYPSNADKTITEKLKRAGRSLDITVLDHLIVTQSAYFSFTDEGLL